MKSRKVWIKKKSYFFFTHSWAKSKPFIYTFIVCKHFITLIRVFFLKKTAKHIECSHCPLFSFNSLSLYRPKHTYHIHICLCTVWKIFSHMYKKDVSKRRTNGRLEQQYNIKAMPFAYRITYTHICYVRIVFFSPYNGWMMICRRINMTMVLSYVEMRELFSIVYVSQSILSTPCKLFSFCIQSHDSPFRPFCFNLPILYLGFIKTKSKNNNNKKGKKEYRKYIVKWIATPKVCMDQMNTLKTLCTSINCSFIVLFFIIINISWAAKCTKRYKTYHTNVFVWCAALSPSAQHTK